jgi:alpha-beta hydrolase superfamily lysophospholipase
VRFVTEDGITIRGWWFPRPETTAVLVCCAGHRGAKHDLLGVGSGLWRRGANVLLFDYRGCGESDPAPQSLAYNELPDARAAVQFAGERIAEAHIGLLGYSMGAAIAIMTAAADQRVEAVVADSAFADIHGVVAHAFRRNGLPPRPLLQVADAYNRWRYGYSFGAVRPIDVVGKIAPRPILIIHGSADALIPIQHAHDLFAASGEPKELWVAEGVEHCGAYFADRENYVERISTFFQQSFRERAVI